MVYVARMKYLPKSPERNVYWITIDLLALRLIKEPTSAVGGAPLADNQSLAHPLPLTIFRFSTPSNKAILCLFPSDEIT